MSNKNTSPEFISGLLSSMGKPIIIRPIMTKILGGLNENVLLSQLIYWTGKQKDPEGWIFKNSREIEEETALNYQQQRRARQKLKSMNLLEEKNDWSTHKILLRINLKNLAKIIANSLYHNNKESLSKRSPLPIKTIESPYHNNKESLSKRSSDIKKQRIHREYTENTQKKNNPPKPPLASSDDSAVLSIKRWFNEVMWPSVPSPKKKGKAKTWSQVTKLKPDKVTRADIVNYFKSYYEVKATYDRVGEFFPDMQDPERVIRNRRYEDELVKFSGQPKGGGMAPSSYESGDLDFIKLMSPEAKRKKLRIEGDRFRKMLIEFGDDPSKYEGEQNAEA